MSRELAAYEMHHEGWGASVIRQTCTNTNSDHDLIRQVNNQLVDRSVVLVCANSRSNDRAILRVLSALA